MMKKPKVLISFRTASVVTTFKRVARVSLIVPQKRLLFRGLFYRCVFSNKNVLHSFSPYAYATEIQTLTLKTTTRRLSHCPFRTTTSLNKFNNEVMMSLNLYELSVLTSLQIVSASINVLNKAKEHLGEEKCNELLTYQLAEDMWPLSRQIQSVKHHSLGSLEGMRRGEFNPPPALPELDYNGFINLIEETKKELEAVSADEVNALEDKKMLFRIGDNFELPFIAQNFAISFSIPNLMFHATTLYDMFRIQGVPVGKTDFLGTPRVGH